MTQEEQRWISVDERLPQYMDYVLVSNGSHVWMGEYGEYDSRPSKKEWGLVYNGAPPFDSRDVKFWMPLPDLPKP